VEERYPTAYNLGSGCNPWPGWINVDSADDADLKADVRALPVESDSADAVAAIHILEHLYEWEALPTVLEWKRILKPGGKMIIELPSMDKVCTYIAYCVARKEQMYGFMTQWAWYGDPKHKSAEMSHKWGWFQKSLHALLREAGMREIQFMSPHYHFEIRDMRVECIK
jgi:ubiquinone/menaquinone biosynthesis C-methylase UbiE